MNIMMQRYEQVKEHNKKLHDLIEHVDLIKRGAMLKVYSSIEQNDKLYFAQMSLIYQQIDDIMEDSNIDIKKKSDIEHQLLKSGYYLTTKWEKESEVYIKELHRIMYA